MTVKAHQETKHFQAEVAQLLNIVVHSLYSNKEIFLRELISNAADAADKLRFAAIKQPALYEDQPTLKIRVSFDKEKKTITLSDNGIGMSRDEIIEQLGTIAKSGTREFLSQLTEDQKNKTNLIGQFGVGFYSAFMVAKHVVVCSRKAGLPQEEGVMWESEGSGEYTVTSLIKAVRGTDVILYLKDNEDEYLNAWRLKSIITKYSDHVNIPIEIIKVTEEGKVTSDWEQVNRASAIWTRPKGEVTDDEYQAFYQHLSHDFKPPLTWTVHRVEGSALNYSCLLYLPSHAPFEIWQRDTQHGLKLYVERVFIMDQIEQFLPYYLRFVRGVIDTASLPLNISRELIQDHPVISKLRASMVRHILDLLDHLAIHDVDKYQLFWNTFGNVLKEGLAEDFVNRDRLATLLRFASTTSNQEAQTVSLKEYVTRMNSDQKAIYYITADSWMAANHSPHLEIFRQRNIEVLLLTDRIDEWVVGHLPSFDNKPLQSIAKGDLNLEEKDDEKKVKEQELVQSFDALLKTMQAILEKDVKTIRLSNRLTDSPVCLVKDEGSLSTHMEKILKASGQIVAENKPILEINPNHPFIKQLQKEQDQTKLTPWVRLLHEEALLMDGVMLNDPTSFVHRLNQLLINKE